MRYLYLALAAALTVTAQAQTAPASNPASTITAARAKADADLNLDPTSSFWKNAHPVFITADTMGNPAPYKTEVRAVWTPDNLYLLYTAPFDELHLHPNPDTTKDTSGLWNTDVVETFIGWDYDHPRQYKELEVSPQGEWVDLDIDRDKMGNRNAILWNSGYKVAAKVDNDKKIWYAEMKIPFKAINNDKPATPGQTLRIGLFRCAGPRGNQLILSWQPTMAKSFHVPEHFGTLLLAKK
jgi:hypothetical protein